MERRDFLSLLAAAPIAALAPLPKFLPKPQLAFHPKAFSMVMAALTATDIQHLGVIYGRGFFRRGNELWEYTAPLMKPRLPVQRFDPARLPT